MTKYDAVLFNVLGAQTLSCCRQRWRRKSSYNRCLWHSGWEH